MHRRTLAHAAGIAGLAALAALPFAPTVFGGEDTMGGGRAGGLDEERAPVDVAMELDFLIQDAWTQEGLEATRLCTDEEYVRRAYLDVIGTIPSADQVRAFVKDDTPGKRAKLVDRLLATPGYARHFTNLWGRVLVGQADVGGNNREYIPALFRTWFETQLVNERPYGEIVTEIVTASGTVYENAPVNFSGRRDHSVTDIAGATSKAFLGVQIQCAQCHDHPYEEISQADFNGMAAFWARTIGIPKEIDYSILGPAAVARAEASEQRYYDDALKAGKSEAEARNIATRRGVRRSRDVKDLETQPRYTTAAANSPRGKAMLKRALRNVPEEIINASPKFLKGATFDGTTAPTRRAALAEWIVDTDNPYTAPALANRYWGWLLGRGFVHPVDDFSSVNIPSVPEALKLLARDTADHEFDLKRLVRIITATRSYQLSTATPERTELADEFFAAGPLKELSPQQTFDSIQIAMGVVKDGTKMSGLSDTTPSSIDMGGRGGMMMGANPTEMSRAERVLRRAATRFFLTFDDDEAEESESFTGTVPQGLFLMNSETINSLLVSPRVSVVAAVLSNVDSDRDRIRHFFLRTLSREPTSQELRRLTGFVKSAEAVKEETPVPRKAPGETDSKKKRKKKQDRRRGGESKRHAAYADVFWALLSSSEFGTNH